MLRIEYDLLPPSTEATQIMLIDPTQSPPEPERVYVLIYGPYPAVEHTINQLHVLRFVDQFRWTPIAAVPEQGILITPTVAETYSLLSRELRRR